MFSYLISLILIVVPLYPKFPLVGVNGSFVSIRLEDLVVAAVYVVWAIWAVKNKYWLKLLPIHRSIILFWLTGLVSVFSGIFLTKTVAPSLGVLHALRRVEYMGLFFLGYAWLTNKLKIKFLIATILIVSAVVALYGLGQQFFQFPVISTNNSEFSKGLALTLGPGARVNSTFAGHYDLAAYSVLPILLILGLLMLRTRGKPILIVLGILAYWAMLLSASRATFVALLVAACLMALAMRQRKWIVIVIIMGAFGLLGSPQLIGRYRELIVNSLKLTLVTPVKAQDDVPDALQPTAIPEDRSLSIRLNASWPRAIRALEINPILGTGYSSIGLAADNDYLRSLAETGLLGTLAFGMIFFRFFKNLKKIVFRPEQKIEHVFILAIVCYLIALLANAIFIDIFEASKIAIITWLLMGLALRTAELS